MPTLFRFSLFPSLTNTDRLNLPDSSEDDIDLIRKALEEIKIPQVAPSTVGPYYLPGNSVMLMFRLSAN